MTPAHYSYLLLESPRVDSLGHRLIVSTGTDSDARCTLLIDSPQQCEQFPDVLVVSHSVKQPSQYGNTSREGIERLSFVCSQIGSADPVLKEQLRKAMVVLLRDRAEHILADPELTRLARDRTVVTHPAMDEWCAILVEVLTGKGSEPPQSSPQVSPPDHCAQRIQGPTGSTAMSEGESITSSERKSPKKSVVPIISIILVLLFGTVAVIKLYPSRTPRNGTSTIHDQYAWLSAYNVLVPRSPEEAERYNAILNACWSELGLLSTANKKSGLKKPNNIQSWMDHVIEKWVNSGENTQSNDARFKQIQKTIQLFRDAGANLSGVSFPDAKMSPSEFMEWFIDKQNQDIRENVYKFAHFEHEPTGFFEKSHRLFNWSKD